MDDQIARKKGLDSSSSSGTVVPTLPTSSDALAVAPVAMDIVQSNQNDDEMTLASLRELGLEAVCQMVLKSTKRIRALEAEARSKRKKLTRMGALLDKEAKSKKKLKVELDTFVMVKETTFRGKQRF
eukprot:999028-Pyramimonas_sp.AAC.1